MTLQEQISQKKEELRLLQEQVRQQSLQEYEKLVGNYYKLSPSEYLRVDKVNSFTSREVFVTGLLVYGGKEAEGNFEVKFVEESSLTTEELQQPITREEFLNFLNQSLDYTRTKLIQ